MVHLDADAFFASVEQAADPRLRGKPVAVGGEKRGIIAAASYEARRFGVFTPMPTVRAKKLCPKLIVLPGDFEKYERFSRWMFSYVYDFTPHVEITSIDEGYFDLAGASRPPADIALIIRRAIGQSLKISVSEGLGSNKLVSQIASKLHKPAAFAEIPAGRELDFLHPLPNRWLPGVGPHTASRLNAAGLARIGQIAVTPHDMLQLLLGKGAALLRQFANGIDERPLVPVRAPAQSYSHQETFAQDQTDEPLIEATLRRMADRLMAAIRADGKCIRTLTLKVRYNDMDETQCGESLAEPTDLESDLYPRIRPLLRQAWKRRVSLRMVSLKLSNVYHGFHPAELPLESRAQHHDAQRRLATVIDQLRHSRGRHVILRGHDLLLRDRDRDPDPNPDPHRSPRPGGGPEPQPQPQPQPELGRRAGPATAARRETVSTRDPNPPSPGPNPNRIPNRNDPRIVRAPACGVPLNVHSYYSFLNSTLSIDALVALAVRYQLRALALTDRNNLHGAVEFVQKTRAAGIRPILGADLRAHNQSLQLYVQNTAGYRNLCRLLSSLPRTSPNPNTSSNSNPVSNPEFASRDFARFTALVGPHAEGLLAVGPDPRLAELFPGRFYLGIASPSPATFKRLHPWRHLPAVASPPIHYASPAGRWKFDVVQSIRTLTLLRQAHPEKRLGGQGHFRAPGTMAALFKDHPGLWIRTAELAARCAFELPFNPPQFPPFHPPDGSTSRAFLRSLVTEGFARRYPSQPAGRHAQIEEELQIIHEVGYEEYFLVVWNLLQHCRRRGIDWITRGSAADSLVCYCLGISEVCPVRFDLYFRRFLNKERMAMHKLPDIDIDFPHDRKDDVVDLIFELYGSQHAAVVGGFSTFQARSAFAEIAKVLGVAERDTRRFTEHFPWSFAGAPEEKLRLVESLRARPDCGDLPLDEEPYKSALEMAAFLDGFPRHPKMHPCGVVLSRQPMLELSPTFVSNKGYPTTHFDMDAVEAIGLVKIDILAQGGLSVMRDVQLRLRQQGIHIDPPGEPWNDPAVWDMIAGGGARAVHHIESPAMVSLCRMCQVRDIDGLIAIVSVIRPGAANEQKKLQFSRRYQGLEPVAYPHPCLEPFLKSTFGLVVYEEHILQLCDAFAGLPLGRADTLRRALVKQQWKTIGDIGLEFLEAARRRGHADPLIETVWDLASGFAGYAFCKAHSTAYGVEAYQSAWLKRHYPAEFMAAVLTHGKGFYHPLVYVLECHRLGIPLLPPCVNHPGPGFLTEVTDPGIGRDSVHGPVRKGRPRMDTNSHESSERGAAGSRSACGGSGSIRVHSCPFVVETNRVMPLVASNIPAIAIRVPVSRIKGLTEATQHRLLAEHRRAPFESLRDFYRRVAPGPEEMESLLRCGALDTFGPSRTALFWDLQILLRAYGHGAALHPAQGWLLPPSAMTPSHDAFHPDPADAAGSSPLTLTEPGRRQRLEWERDLLDFPASGHPLELHGDVAWDTYCPVAKLGDHVGQRVVACGLVIEQRVHHQVTGEPMKFLTLADWTGMVETELFAPTYRAYGLATVRYPVLEVTATVEPFDNGCGFTLRVHRAGKPRQKFGVPIPQSQDGMASMA